MKSLKEYAEEMRAMAAMLNETADSLGSYHDEQLRGVLAAMGLSQSAPRPTVEAPLAPPLAPTPAGGAELTQKIRMEYAALPPEQRTSLSRQDLARKYSITETQVMNLLQGPIQNGALTRK